MDRAAARDVHRHRALGLGSRRRKQAFDAAARLPLEDDDGTYRQTARPTPGVTGDKRHG